MRIFGVEHQGQIVTREGQPIPSEELDNLTDRIQDELLSLPDAIDPDITTSLAIGVVHFSLSVKAADAREALAKGGSVIRAALHAAEVATPDWEPLGAGELVEDSDEFDWQEADWRITRDDRDLIEA